MRGQKKNIRLAITAVIAGLATLGVTGGQATNATESSAAQPHVLEGPVADVTVRLAGALCSGTPITGTRYVVTAAHCVLTAKGEVTTRSVERDGVIYTAVAEIVDTRYVDHPNSAQDAAVLVMPEVIPGPSARLGAALPDSGHVTLAGFQPIDSNGTLLRGLRPSDRPRPAGATGTVHVESRPAGCVVPVAKLDIKPVRVMLPCGLIPGASGGGLLAEDDGELVLVGIVSTVTVDLTANGVVPLASLLELLAHADRYTHTVPEAQATSDHTRLILT